MNELKDAVLQFGEGGFLRGFVDNFIHQMNEQGGRYHLYERGMENGVEMCGSRRFVQCTRRTTHCQGQAAFGGGFVCTLP